MERVASHEEPSSSSSQAESPTYAFLNHSTNTLVNKLPPDVDNKPLARQKRKRTSPEDQSVLEAAYQRDPKPDKDARLKLVEQIALGEKEVQIWFQNRRQTSRRKSRPLLPHEIAQFQMSRYGSLGIENMSSDPADHDVLPAVTQSGSSRSSDCTEDSPDGPGAPSDPIDTQSLGADVKPVELPSLQDATFGYLANRRSLPSLSQVLDDLNHTKPPLAPPTHTLKKPASFVRLSMTSAGNAKVITKDSLSPSPPRRMPQSEHMLELQQAREVSPSREITSLKRSASGRSRDSRAWEFWCDKDCRLELEEKAEKDGKGSAADAIGLIRAANSRKALQPIVFKQNSAISKHQPWMMKQIKADRRQPALQRAQTSAGRLQNGSNVSSSGNVKRKRLEKIGTSVSIYIPGNESDKENWSPGAETTHGHSKAKMLPAAKLSKSGDKADSENISPESDAEVAAFMSGGRSRRVAQDEELDCVQGLLSLSQGNWAV